MERSHNRVSDFHLYGVVCRPWTFQRQADILSVIMVMRHTSPGLFYMFPLRGVTSTEPSHETASRNKQIMLVALLFTALDLLTT